MQLMERPVAYALGRRRLVHMGRALAVDNTVPCAKLWTRSQPKNTPSEVADSCPPT